jgi:uncharacterized protein
VDTEAFTPIAGALGGVLIGLAAGLTLLLNGKIAGISGVMGRILRFSPDSLWRGWFLIGLITAGAIGVAAFPSVAQFTPQTSLPMSVLAGLLVGVGTRLGGGCTSGHGVCGMARASTGGTTATVVFMAVAFACVYVTRHLVAA